MVIISCGFYTIKFSRIFFRISIEYKSSSNQGCENNQSDQQLFSYVGFNSQHFTFKRSKYTEIVQVSKDEAIKFETAYLMPAFYATCFCIRNFTLPRNP